MSEKKKNSFRDTILIVFVVILCFGLTVYGIVYLTGKVFSNEEKIEIAKIKNQKISTDPESGDILTFSLEEEKPVEIEDVPPATSIEEENKVKTKVIVGNSVGEKQKEVEKKPVATEKKEEKPAPKKEPVKETKKTEPKKEVIEINNKEAKKADKKPVTTVKENKKGAYVVQILAVANLKDAEKEAGKYRQVCSDVFIQKADLGSKGIWYRVRCGATNSKSDAVVTRDLIKSKFKGVNPQVVSNK